MCIFLEFFGFFTPPLGSSTIPEPKKGELSSLANRKLEPLTSLVSIPEGAYAMSTHQKISTINDRMEAKKKK